MPLYSYRCADNHLTSRFFPSDKIRRTTKCEICGSRSRRHLGCNVAPNGNFPMTSAAVGVAVSQIEEATRASNQPGMVPVTFDEKGDAELRSQKHRKDYCESVGYFDRDGGYGDPMPTGKANQSGDE